MIIIIYFVYITLKVLKYNLYKDSVNSIIIIFFFRSGLFIKRIHLYNTHNLYYY